MMFRLYIVHLSRQVVLNIVTMVLGRRANRAGAMPFHGARRVQPPCLEVRFDGARIMIAFSMFTVTEQCQEKGVVRMRHHTIGRQVNHNEARRARHQDMGSSGRLTMGTSVTRRDHS